MRAQVRGGVSGRRPCRFCSPPLAPKRRARLPSLNMFRQFPLVGAVVSMALATFVVTTTLASTFAQTQTQTPAPRRVNLTGTVVAVNQQSDTITLVDLKTMEAYRHVQVVAGPHEAAVSPDGRSV